MTEQDNNATTGYSNGLKFQFLRLQRTTTQLWVEWTYRTSLSTSKSRQRQVSNYLSPLLDLAIVNAFLLHKEFCILHFELYYARTVYADRVVNRQMVHLHTLQLLFAAIFYPFPNIPDSTKALSRPCLFCD